MTDAPRMSRAAFVKGYANRSGLSDKWAPLGLVEIGDHKLIALPCECGEDGCDGWAMLGAEAVLHHLWFHAPDAMRRAYCEIVGSP